VRYHWRAVGAAAAVPARARWGAAREQYLRGAVPEQAEALVRVAVRAQVAVQAQAAAQRQALAALAARALRHWLPRCC
jgi:hypothetical protein